MAEIIALSKRRLLADVCLIQRSRQYFIRQSGFIPSYPGYAQGTECSFGHFERGGPGFSGAASPPYRSLAVLEKKLRNFSKRNLFGMDAGVAAAHGIEMSSHLLPEISAHLLAASPTCHYLEYVDWAESILEEPLQIQDGLARVPDRPGIGLTWRSKAVKALSLDR